MPNDRKLNFDIEWGRVVVFFGGVPASWALSYPLFGRYSQSEAALSAAAGVSATFAGFIIAILTILGDASALLPGSWRVASAQASEIRDRFRRLQYIFFCYLFASFSALYMIVTMNDFTPNRNILAQFSCFILIYCFFVSLELPKSLKSIQRDRVEAIIAQRMERDKSEAQKVPIPSEVDK